MLQIMKFVSSTENSFDINTVPEKLVNIATGQVAIEVSNGLEHFLEDACKRNEDFISK